MKDEKVLERWHGAHHYSNKVHLMLVFVLFFAMATLLWSYMELNNPKLVNYEHRFSAPTAKPTPAPKTTCTPRPACFDSVPRCMMPETSDMCPPSVTPSSNPVACSMIAMLCPDGKTYVGRTGPNCDFAACPGEHCGGNIAFAKQCSGGYHCQLNIKIPDAGGTCVKN